MKLVVGLMLLLSAFPMAFADSSELGEIKKSSCIYSPDNTRVESSLPTRTPDSESDSEGTAEEL